MKTIARRLQKLEDGLGLRPETEFERQLSLRIEAGLRRVAEARARGDGIAPGVQPIAVPKQGAPERV